MATTADLKNELAQLANADVSARRAEVSTLLWFAGGVHIDGGRLVIQADVDCTAVAKRLCSEIQQVFGHHADMRRLSTDPERTAGWVTVRVTAGADVLARQVALLDGQGRPTRGLPPARATSSLNLAAAVWRGAVLARGAFTGRTRALSLSVVCPGPDAAVMLVRAAGRLGVPAKTATGDRGDRVIIRGSDAVGTMLASVGAHRCRRSWIDGESGRTAVSRSVNLDEANTRRSLEAAAVVSARVQRAMLILGDSIPAHLGEAGRLRLQHSSASLDELARLTMPPTTKDALAGRLRRLLIMADKNILELGDRRQPRPTTPPVITSAQQP